MTGILRERLQNQSCGRSLAMCSTKDFPSPEDPPVTTTALKGWSICVMDGMASWSGLFSGGISACNRNETQKHEQKQPSK
jgi:hypothetical protein